MPCQCDGLSEGTGVTSKATNRGSRKRLRSRSSDGEKDESGRSENSNSSPLKTHQEKSSTDPCELPLNGSEKKSSSNGSLHRRLSETNLENNHSSKSPHSAPMSPKIEKPKVIQSPRPSNFEEDESSSASETTHHQASSTTTSKPVREAKKRSLIYTGNTREFLETAIAAGLIDANGEEEDEDNEYVPPGGSVAAVQRRRASSPSSSSSNSDQEQASTNDTDDADEDEDEDGDEEQNSSNKNDDEEEEEGEVNDENVEQNEPSESNVTWNVRNRPQRRTHLIRFDNISEQDGKRICSAPSRRWFPFLW